MTLGQRNGFIVRGSDGSVYMGEDLEGHWFAKGGDVSHACVWQDRDDAQERAALLTRQAFESTERERRCRERLDAKFPRRWHHGYPPPPSEPVPEARTFEVEELSEGVERAAA